MSLRRNLLIGVALVLLLAGAVTAAIGGYGMRDEVNDMLDQHLMQIAELASATADAHPLPAQRWQRELNRDNELVVQRWGGDSMTDLLARGERLPRPTQPGFSEVLLRGRIWKSFALQTDSGWVAVAQPAEARDELIEGAILMAILPSLVGLPLIGLVIVLLIRRALAPLQNLTQTLEQRPAFSSEPLPTSGLPLETRPLVIGFNHLLARVSTAVARERDFVTDAAHALRTPITAMQLQAESLREAKSRSDFSERLNDLISGIARGRHTVEQLLTLARAEHYNAGSTEIRAALNALPQRFNVALQAHSLILQLKVATPDSTCVAMHPHTLEVVLDNLLDNAIRYSPPQGVIEVGAKLLNARVRIWVRDFGPGLSRQ